jgi:predicted TIM-barrel fold metal-dependent hydrolase
VNRFDSLVHVTRDGRWFGSDCDAGYDRLVAELDRGGVDRACLVGLAGVVDNEYVLECARRADGRLVPVAGINPAAPGSDGAEAVRAAVRDGFAGIKLHPRLHGYDPLDGRCLDAIRAAAASGLVVFLDTLFRQPGVNTINAADAIDRIAAACGGARVVLLHGGGPALLALTEVVRAHRSLVLDLSFTILHYAGSSLDADIRWTMRRLDQRLVLGSDMPEYTPAEAFARARELAGDLADDQWANIAHGNLCRLFAPGRPA